MNDGADQKFEGVRRCWQNPEYTTRAAQLRAESSDLLDRRNFQPTPSPVAGWWSEQGTTTERVIGQREPTMHALLYTLLMIGLQLAHACLSLARPNGVTPFGMVPAFRGRTIDAPRKIRIFLASSAELRTDRDAFELFVLRKNHRLIGDGLYLEVERWEHFLDAMSDTRMQDEYNRAVARCDIFVSLFLTRTGSFTEEEFDTAHRAHLATGRPKVFTFFKQGSVDIHGTDPADLVSLARFKDRLRTLGHFHTMYTSQEDLQLRFLDQFHRLRDAGEV